MFYTVPKNNERRLSLQALFPILENGWLTKKGKGKSPPPPDPDATCLRWGT